MLRLSALIPLLACIRYLPFLPFQQHLAHSTLPALLRLRLVPLLLARMASLTLLQLAALLPHRALLELMMSGFSASARWGR